MANPSGIGYLINNDTFSGTAYGTISIENAPQGSLVRIADINFNVPEPGVFGMVAAGLGLALLTRKRVA